MLLFHRFGHASYVADHGSQYFFAVGLMDGVESLNPC